MDNGLTKDELKHYLEVVIPTLEDELSNGNLDGPELMEKYDLYLSLLRLVARDDFGTFNKYLEIDENHNDKNKAFYAHRKEALDEVITALNDMEIHNKYDTLLISMPPRIGKALTLDSKLLTPTGWIRNGEVKVGDKVIGHDGGPVNVTGVFPQGIVDTYEVVFDDGTKVKCSGDHLWTVWDKRNRKNVRERTLTTLEMSKEVMFEKGNRARYSIDYVKPVEFENSLSDDDLPPYLLGALIGDGGLSSEGIRFTNIDQDVLTKVESLIHESDSLNKVSDTITYGIVKKDISVRDSRGWMVKSHTDKKITEYGLKHTSYHKFIPKKYLYSSIENRLELLKGLMDTDGYTSKGNNTYCEYSTTSKQLSEDVVELVRSLGGRVTVFTKKASVGCAEAYRIAFNMELNPFYCERKRIRFKPRKTRPHKRIVEINKIENEECVCISVDDVKSLYVTDGYNLTHNTTSGIRFLSWIIGRYPEETQLATSYSDNITKSFYIGVMEIVEHDRYKEIFPESPLVMQNAKREEIWLKRYKRYPSISFVPINGSMTGRSEASRYLYCDDLVSGIEEALSPDRLGKLWEKYTTDAKQRKLEGCKEIHIATPWSVHDVMSKLKVINEDNSRVKIVELACYDENGESNFDFVGGFSTEYYKEIESTMDASSFSALYLQQPIERDGILYNKDELMYYFDLPKERPDAVVAVVDSKNLGKDYVSCPIAYVYGEQVYIEDVVFNNGLPEVTKELVANALIKHKVNRTDVEMNNGGNYYAEGVNELVKEKGGNTTFRLFFTSNNKVVKIISMSDFVKKRFLFKDPSTYSPNSVYAKFMQQVHGWTQTGKNKHDDAVDTLAMLAQLVQDLEGSSIKIVKRSVLGL